MKNSISIKSAPARIITGLLLILGFGITSGSGQSLNTDGALNTAPDTNRQDYIIPSSLDKPYLYLSAQGADGGVRHLSATLYTCTKEGGQGARVAAWFKIGNDGLQPGGNLRFVFGKKGTNTGKQDHISSIATSTSNLTAGAGGGGGSAVLYLPPGADGTDASKWQILLVAGGGGGGASDGFCSGVHGQPGQAGTSGSDGTGIAFGKGGSNGEGGKCGAPGASGGGWYHPGQGYCIAASMQTIEQDLSGHTTYINFGGGLSGSGMRSGSNAHWVGGLGGAYDLMRDEEVCSGSYFSGGYGFGGGGAGFGSGGGGATGIGFGAGGGGGSYVNHNLTMPFSKSTALQRGTTSDPQNGIIQYKFTNTAPVATRDLWFEAHHDQEVSVLAAGEYTLLWQYDGNLVLYGSGGPVWASNTAGTDIYFQGDGNLVIYQANAGPVWSSNTPNDHYNGKGGRKLVLTSEGKLFIADPDGKTIWQGH